MGGGMIGSLPERAEDPWTAYNVYLIKHNDNVSH